MDKTTSFHFAASQRMFRPTNNGLSRIGFLVVLCLIAVSSVCRAAVVEKRVWVWMGGAVPLTATNNGETGVYGTLGVPATTNMPGVRGSALSWTDSYGNLWLFGGQTISPAGSSSNEFLNDLWKYSPTTGEWAWMSGSDPAASNALPIGVYGALGHDLATNVPGARSGLVGWTDSSGNLWLFGGYGYDSAGTLGYLNDLWKFNPTTSKWTWMGGSSTVPASEGGVAGVYGTPGTIPIANQPGSRSGMVSWTDSSGNFWLFGGNGFDSAGTRGDLNDLWMYSTATNQWKWINGSNLANQSGSYGNLGVSSSTNVPSGRAAAGGWIDSANNLWLFGGGGPGSVGMNDLWKYSTSTGQWTWVSGSITPGATGVYGIMGDASATNVPGGRVCVNTWIDSAGNLWLFGGSGYDSTGTKGFLDDLWQFNPSTGQWMWMNGSSSANQAVNYGTLATPSSVSTPGGRYCPSSWLDGNGNFWLFGGWYQTSSGNNSYPLNDLWESGGPTSAPTFSPAAGSYTSAQTVTIAGVGTGAIYYTTDGTTPTASSTLYTGPITVSSTETLEAIAVVPGYLNSAPSSATYTLSQSTTATPQITPASGTYTSVQSIALLDSTSGATIYYTTDGSTPTANSTRYTGLISIAVTTTLKAIAIAPNYGNSSVLTATYTLLLQPAATPTFSPAAGTYNTTQSVTISDATPNTTIYYSTNGNTPTSASTIYSGPITVSANETIQATAIASGYSPSSTATATYTIAQTALATPTFSVAEGTYSTAQTVAISDTTTNATICYTTDGSTPTTASTIYTGPLTVSATETLRAVAFKSGYTQSDVATATYTITQTTTATPIFSPAAGSYTTAQSVTISTTTTNATIYYTTNGSTPTSLSAVYTGPITVSSTETIVAMAVANNTTRSGVATATYTIAQTAVGTPAFSPAAGSYSTAQSVTIFTTPTNASIYYTTNGSTPTTTSPLYTGPISVSSTVTLQAIAIVSGSSPSAVGSATYTIAQTATATPTLSPAAGSYTTAQSVSISDTTSNATIYFTTDGSTPTSLSAVYNGPITVSSSETIEAIAVASNTTRSGVAVAAYTIAQPVVATPTFSVATGIFTAPQTITIVDSTAATTICYTTDGSTPTSASPVYTGPLTISATETLRAVAYKSGYTQSAVASATYVFPITPTITWPTPTAITYGTPLSTIQLDATASVAGTFTYSSAIGAVLPAGSNTLSVAFTPKDQTNYTSATASVTLIVNVLINPAPVISSISPAFVTAGSSAFTLTVNGSGFDSGSTVYWGSTALVTKVVSSIHLTATVPAQSIANAGVFAVLVQSPTPGGGVSTALQFEVDSSAAGTILPPTISSTTVYVTAGSTAVYSVTTPSTTTNLTVSCLNMPIGASCTYSATTHQVIISTSPNTPKGVYQITVVFASTSTIPASAFVLLPILLLPLAFAVNKRKAGLTSLLSLILLTATLFASGCGDSITQSVFSTASSLVSLTIQ